MKSPPGPNGLPFIGSLFRARRNPLSFALDLTRECGDIAAFRIGIYSGYLVNHPDYFQHVLQSNSRNYSKANYNYNKLKPVLGEGLITADGDSWLRNRRLIQPLFHKKRIAQDGSIITRTVANLLKRWEKASASNQPINLSASMMRLSLRIIIRILFSQEIDTVTNYVLHAFTTLNEDVAYRFRSVFVPPLWIPTRRNRAFNKAKAELDEVVYALIRKRRENDTSQNDLLDMLLSAREEPSGEGLTDKQIRDEAMTLMLAGHETTANLLTWACYLLSQHPSVLQTLQTELQKVIGGRLPTTEDLPRLGYTKQVLQESLRLYPPVWIISRRAINNDMIAGYSIPAGSTVTLCAYTLHRHPDFWRNPELFRPERFAPARVNKQPPVAYFPFGAGPRACVGSHLALTEAQLILATIFQRYRLTMAPGQPVTPEPLVTLRPRNDLYMTVSALAS